MRPLELQAGPLRMRFEPWDGFLRHIRLGNHELVQGIYAAVRIENWATVRPELLNIRTEIQSHSFHLSWESECGGLLRWFGEIEGDENGRVSYSVTGKPLKPFCTMRTGICVLHPAQECRGLTCHVTSSAGEEILSAFPDHISPYQPFSDIRSIRHAGPVDTELTVDFSGEVFEMEDQRNWSDASFKTYCRPLSWATPYMLSPGQAVVQSIALSLRGDCSRAKYDPVVASVQTSKSCVKLPKIGTTLNLDEPIAPTQIDAIRSMGFDHLAIWIHPARSNYGELRERSAPFELPLELLVDSPTPEDADTMMAEIADWPIARILILSDHPGDCPIVPDERLSSLAPVFAGAPNNFTELNRRPPDMALYDGVSFGVNPQVHAFDDTSIFETTEMLDLLVSEAKRISKGKPVAVSPLTFEPWHWRTNDPDKRLSSREGGAWTLAALHHLIQGEPESITLFETHGARGFTGGDLDVRPIAAVLRQVLSRKKERIKSSRSTRPIRAEAICFESGESLVANCTGRMIPVSLGTTYELEPFETRLVGGD